MVMTMKLKSDQERGVAVCLAPLLRLEEYGCVLLEGISPNDGHVGINVGINVGITASLGNIAPTDFSLR